MKKNRKGNAPKTDRKAAERSKRKMRKRNDARAARVARAGGLSLTAKRKVDLAVKHLRELVLINDAMVASHDPEHIQELIRKRTIATTEARSFLKSMEAL